MNRASANLAADTWDAADGLLIAREREFVAVQRALDAAVAGHGSLYLVSGEPGAGKTRFLEAIAAAARRRDVLVAWGRGWQGADAPPFWLWVQVLRELVSFDAATQVLRANQYVARQVARLLPEANELPDAPVDTSVVGSRKSTAAGRLQTERFELLDGIVTFLRGVAARRPLVLLLDDLHAAQLPALVLLELLSRDLAESSLLVVSAFQEGKSRADDAFDEQLGALACSGTAIALRSLDVPAIRALVEKAGGCVPSDDLVERIYTATGGNPFFVTELIRLHAAEGRFDDVSLLGHGALAVSERVRTFVQTRLGRVPSKIRAVLEVAAAIGGDFDIDLVAAVLQAEATQVMEALSDSGAVSFVRSSLPGRFAFIHAVVREAIYSGLPAPRRVRLHARIGAALEARHGANVEPVLPALALHFLQGQPETSTARAIIYARHAGEQAHALLAYEQAITYFEQALGVIDRSTSSSSDERGELLLALGRAAMHAGDLKRARESVRAAATEARRMGSAMLLTRAALTLRAGGDGGVADPEQVALLEEALATLGSEQSTWRVRLLAHLARELYHGHDVVRRETLSREAVSVARTIGDRATLARALATRCFAMWGTRHDEERLPLAAELLDLARQTGDRELAIEAHHWRVIDFLTLGDLAAVDREILAASTLAERLRQPYYRWWCAKWRAMRATLAGRFADGERLAKEGWAIGKPIQPLNAATSLNSQVIEIHWHRGELAQLVPMLESYATESRADSLEYRIAHAWVLSHAGRLDDARREFEGVVADDLRALVPRAGWATTVALAAETCVALEDVRHAPMFYELLEQYVGCALVLGPAEGCFGPADRFLGLLAGLRGDWNGAEEHFTTSLRLAQRLASPPWVARTQADFASMLCARGQPGDRARAAALGAEAQATAERLGMKGVAEQAATVLSRAAATSGRSGPPVVGADHQLALEGEYWTVQYRTVVSRVRDRIGLTYLAALLERPHEQVPAFTLATGLATLAETALGHERTVRWPADLGETLDGQARLDYRVRLAELEAELEAAEQDHDLGRTGQLRTEIAFLRGELESALGLDGRARRTGSPVERARVRVTRALRETIDRLHAVDAALGAHLDSSVRTGTYCTYAPAAPTRWTIIRPSAQPPQSIGRRGSGS